jgi:hypothetical protein
LESGDAGPETTFTDDTGTTTPPGDETEIPREPPRREESTTTGVASTTTTEAATTMTEGTTTTVVYLPLEAAEQLHGVWYDHTPGHGVYLGFDAGGQWAVYVHYDPDTPHPYHTGTYTLDSDEITMFDDPQGSICAGEVGVWTIAISQGGDDAYFTFVEDSCTESVRSEDWTLVRHSP